MEAAVSTFVSTTAMTLGGSAWTGTAPGAGNPTVTGTITTSTDWSDHLSQVAFDMSRANIDFTNFGAGGFIEQKPGLAGCDLVLSFFNDFAASVDATFGPAAIAGTLLFFDVKPTSAARGTGNPSYVGGFYIAKYPPMGVQVGAGATSQIGFMQAGKYARLTS